MDESKNKTNESNTEQVEVKSKDLLQKIKDLIKQGNIRRLIIKSKKGDTLLSIPVNVGLISVIIAPFLGVIAGITALATECTIYIERKN